MAAVGFDCPVNEKVHSTSQMSRNRSSCYSNRIIQAYTDKFILENGDGCSYHKDSGVTGVLCCERRKAKSHRTALVRGKAEYRIKLIRLITYLFFLRRNFLVFSFL